VKINIREEERNWKKWIKWKEIKIEIVNEIKIFKKWTKEKNVKKCESKEENKNWNSCIISAKENDEFKRKEKIYDFRLILGPKRFTWLKPIS